MAAKQYHEISLAESQQLPEGVYCHAAHAMLYAPWAEKLFGKYESKHKVMLQMRFDGTLGFPGGLLEKGESPEGAATRELAEEMGCTPADVSFSQQDYVVTHYSEQTRLVLHFFAKEVTAEQFLAMERGVPVGSQWGREVIGLVRCPLYTLPNGLGLPVFLRHAFIGNSRDQLLFALQRRQLLSSEEVRLAIEASKSVDCLVTVNDINY